MAKCMLEVDSKFMARCIELARCGAGYVSPNPMVGAVVVYDGKIIGEGFHRRCGEAHAEVNAIASVVDKSLLRDSTLYVSLEPCSHYGKTPPCAELIINMGIPRVVVGCMDPFPEVSGRGVRMLRVAGVEVVTGVMEREARELNHAFMTLQQEDRPYVILKWAQSEDGFIDMKREDASTPAVRLSTSFTTRMVHKLRSEVSAIMVGRRTASLDNPSLNVREWVGNSPVRVLLDRRLSVPTSYRLFDGSIKSLVFTEMSAQNMDNLEYVTIDFSSPVIPQVLRELAMRKLDSLLVEGGACLINSFVESGLWDEARVEIAPICLGDGVVAPKLPPASAFVRDGSICYLYRRGREV
ncbi:riboflavin biosynthesis protein RibD [gut metagenome]|uniref:Riboflavin biosynthesis protein RibD n=1 Tax=gut metagenome TaxID=749906 RepID=J9CYM6_9ZZZZ